MKIAFIQTNFPTSGNTFLTNRITGMIDRGHDVTIYADAPEKNLSKLHEDIVEYKLLDETVYFGTALKRIQKLKAVLQDLLKFPPQTIERLRKSRNKQFFYQIIKVLINNGDYDISLKFRKRMLTSYFWLKTLENLNTDIVYNHTGPTGNKFLFLKHQNKSLKYITSFIGFDFSSRVRTIGIDYYKELFKYGDIFLTQSFYSRNCLIDLGCPPEKVIKHPVGVYIKKFNYKRRYLNSPNDKIHFIIVARLVEKKAHRLLLDVFEKVFEKYPKVMLHIVGDGPNKHMIQNRITNDELLRKNVTFHGWKTQGEVINLLNQAHIFIHPSVTGMRWAEQEDTTTTLSEAQAMGLPVISTFHAGIPEVVKHNETGILVPERNEKALLEAVEYLIKNPQKWEIFGKNGREWVENNFDIDLLNNRLSWLLNEIIKLKPGEKLGLESTEEISQYSVEYATT